MSDKVLQLLKKWNPDFGDLPISSEDDTGEEKIKTRYSPGNRKTERPGHVGMQRRPHTRICR